MSFQWLDPWQPVDDWSTDQMRQVENELAIEVGYRHPLYSIPVTVIGIRCDCDDTLFKLNDGSLRFAVVHLTWRHSQESIPWPETQLFESFDAFTRTRMRIDHVEYNGLSPDD